MVTKIFQRVAVTTQREQQAEDIAKVIVHDGRVHAWWQTRLGIINLSPKDIPILV